MGISESKTTIEASYLDYIKVNQKKQQIALLPLEADCCNNERKDDIILIDCGHLYHQNCLKQRLKEPEQFICFCGSEIHFKREHFY